MNTSILICGVGGQGIVLASKLIAQSAMNRGIPVMSAETIGMAQKGGSVFSYIRLGEGLSTPMIPLGGADLIIGFEPAETVRCLPYLKEGGAVVTSSCPVRPVTSLLAESNYDGTEMIDYLKKHISRLTVIDTDLAAEKVGSSKAVNMILLGAALRTGALPVTSDDVKEAMKERVRPQFIEMNCRALDLEL